MNTIIKGISALFTMYGLYLIVEGHITESMLAFCVGELTHINVKLNEVSK